MQDEGHRRQPRGKTRMMKAADPDARGLERERGLDLEDTAGGVDLVLAVGLNLLPASTTSPSNPSTTQCQSPTATVGADEQPRASTHADAHTRCNQAHAWQSTQFDPTTSQQVAHRVAVAELDGGGAMGALDEDNALHRREEIQELAQHLRHGRAAAVTTTPEMSEPSALLSMSKGMCVLQSLARSSDDGVALR
eukprot:3705765-Rhodomonas_salina.1